MNATAFNKHCNACSLSERLAEVRTIHPDYYAYPVPAFGKLDASFLVVGLAPGLHGANRTGRPFTGDWCGPLLYDSLHAFGFSNQGYSDNIHDGLEMQNCRITNAVKCWPPENKPELTHIRTCNQYLSTEIANSRSQLRAILTLGTISHQAVFEALGLKPRQYPFAHGAVHQIDSQLKVFDSYHVSRYNTQTKRLTPEKFHDVLNNIKSWLEMPFSH